MSFSDSDSDAEIFRENWGSPLPSPPHPASLSPESPLQAGPCLSPVPLKRQRQPETPLARFDLTVMGYLFRILEGREEALSEKELVDKVSEKLEDLRRIDGSKYAKSANLVVRGCLCNSELFQRHGTGWVMRPANAERYKEHMLQTIKKRINRHIGPAHPLLPSPVYHKTKASESRYRLILLLERLSRHMQGTDDLSFHFKTPFKTFTGMEEITDVAKTMGNEKFLGILQGFDLLSGHFEGLGYKTAHITEKISKSNDLKLIQGISNGILKEIKQIVEK